MKLIRFLLICCSVTIPNLAYGIVEQNKNSEHYSLQELELQINRKPNNFNNYVKIIELLEASDRYEDAIKYQTKALEIKPNDISSLFKIGFLYTQVGRIEDAVQAYEKVLKLRPNNPSALYNIGYALKEADRIDEAIALYEQVTILNPDSENAHLALGRAYIKKGDFETGWRLHERYLKKSGKNADKLRALLANNDLNGKTIFLVPEGGLGDTLQFIRYAQVLKNSGATIVALIQKPLVPLISRCSYIDKIVITGERKPGHHADATLMSLPTVFNSNDATIPKNIPYLFPDPVLVTHWQQQLAADTNFKIGICWQASLANDESRSPIAHRGIPLTNLLPLCAFKNVSIYSVQKYDGEDQLNNLPAGCVIKTFGADFDTTHGAFMDTAAVMENLDLIITVDTATAHLAGALGKPVWILLPYSTDWRWIVGRTDTPWYPSMRIFKQPAPFDWENVMHKVTNELGLLLQNKQQR